MVYAVKSVDENLINAIYTNWQDVKDMVLGHRSVYKSFEEQKDAEDFLKIETADMSYEKGYIPFDASKTSVTARYLFTRYKNAQSGFMIAVYQTNKGKRVTCVGYNLPENKRLLFCFGGKFSNNKKYGYQFDVESFKEVITDSENGIVTYLTSGVFKGIGEKKAKAIYEMFGSRTMDVLENEPERLKYVKGFSKKSAIDIGEQYKNSKATREITQFLLSYGISQKYAVKIYGLHKENALQFVKEHPYSLCKFRGLTFEDADNVARGINYPLNDKERITYAIYHTLKQNELCGDIGMEWNAFGIKVQKVLGKENVTAKEIVDVVTELVKGNRLRIKRIEHKGEVGRYVMSNEAYQRELSIADNIMRLRESKPFVTIKDADALLKEMEERKGITLDSVQRSAVIEGVSGSPFFVITGGAGTGKTSILNMIADMYATKSKNIVLLAPTGRASRKMSEATKRESATLHSYLHLYDTEEDAESEVEIKDALVVVDEFSMADAYISEALFNAITDGCRVILIGDVNQLPSVGCGAVLRDIIDSGAIKTIRLEKLYRQNENSKISENANKINKGDITLSEGMDFHVHECSTMEDAKNIMAELYVKKVEQYGLKNVMCLCPFKEHTAGVKDMNKVLQDLINPRGERKEIKTHGEKFRAGDLVMHTRNTKDASNGDIGIITEIDASEDEPKIVVEINEQTITYEKDDFEMLTLAYATTVHKSQGSEAKEVIFDFTLFHDKNNILCRNLAYVAVSRGKENVDFVGDTKALKKAIRNEVKNERVTLVGRLLTFQSGNYVRV